MNDTHQRLADLMKREGLDQSGLADAIGVSQSTISLILKGKTQRSRHLPEIASFFGVSLDWLRGESDEPDPSGSSDANHHADRLDSVLVPVASAEFALGAGGEVEDSFITDHVPFSRKWLRDLGVTRFDQVLLQPSRGDSMLPTINDRDLLLVDRTRTEVREPDLIWSFLYAGHGYVKRLRRLPKGGYEAISDNDIYKPIIAAEEEIQIVGQVLSAMRWRL